MCSPVTGLRPPHQQTSATVVKRSAIVAAISVLLVSQTGCGKLLHNLKPHRLRMLNYNSSSGRDDVFFSVSDPLTPKSSTPAAVTNTPNNPSVSPDTTGT